MKTNISLLKVSLINNKINHKNIDDIYINILNKKNGQILRLMLTALRLIFITRGITFYHRCHSYISLV